MEQATHGSLATNRTATGIRVIKRIEIIDFMAHKRTVLDLDPGLTVLTGPNNTGKSAVVEAIRSVAENPPPGSVIRHGARKTLVRLELDSGQVVEWDRTPSRALYRIIQAPSEAQENSVEPEPYAKFGRTPPDDVRALLRLDPIQTETGKVDIHIGNQRYPIFLLDQSGAQAASFFAASTEAEYLLQMQQELKARTDSAKRRRKEIVRNLEQLEQAMKRYADLPGISARIERAEGLHEKLRQNRQILPALQQAIGTLEETATRQRAAARSQNILQNLVQPPVAFNCHALGRSLETLLATCRRQALANQRRSILEPLHPLPKTRETAVLEGLRKSLESTGQSLRTCARRQESLTTLNAPPALFDATALDRLLTRKRQAETQYRQLRRLENHLTTVRKPPRPSAVTALEELVQAMTGRLAEEQIAGIRARQLEAVKPPAELRKVSALHEVIARLEEKRTALREIRQRQVLLGNLKAPPDATENTGLMDLIRTCRSILTQIGQTKNRRTDIETGLAEKREAIAQLVARIGVCPFCRQPMDLDHFLEIPHAS